MDFETVVAERRSIRKFLPIPVAPEQIEALLACARLCQSAKNRQPWRFLVLEGAQKDCVADIMLDLFATNDIPLPGYVNSSKSSAAAIKQAPLLLLVFREDREKDDNWHTGDLLSIGAAIEHICLEAVNLGLGSVWIRDTVYTEDEICRAFGREGLALVSAVAVGYPAEHPAPRPRKRMDELLLSPR